MTKVSDILKDLDSLILKYTEMDRLIQENTALKAKLSWAKQCFKQSLEVLGHGDDDSRVAYLETMFGNYFEAE